MIRFRTATPQDAPALAQVWRSAVLATHDFLSPQDFEQIAISVSNDYLPSASLLLTVDGDDRPLGFLGMSHAHIDALFIAAEHRGKGLGKALVQQAETMAKALDSNQLSVDVNEQNPQAVAFYKRLGFTETGRSALDGDGRPYPLLHMAKPLVPDAQLRTT